MPAFSFGVSNGDEEHASLTKRTPNRSVLDAKPLIDAGGYNKFTCAPVDGAWSGALPMIEEAGCNKFNPDPINGAWSGASAKPLFEADGYKKHAGKARFPVEVDKNR